MPSGAGVFCASIDLMAVKLILLTAWVKTYLVCMKSHAN
jgi:hypothetical protein